MSRKAFYLFALYLAGVGAAAQIAKIIPVFDHLLAAHGLSLPQSTLVMSAIGIAAIIFGMAAGRIVVVFGLWRAMLVSLIIAVSMGLILPYATGFGWIFFIRLIEGLGHIGIVTAAPTLMVSLVSPTYAGFVLSIWASFFGVAFAASQLLAATGLNEIRPDLFLQVHTLFFLPALLLCPMLVARDVPALRRGIWREVAFLPRGGTLDQRMVALSFFLHAGVFTSMLAFAHVRVGGQSGALVAPLLPLMALLFVFIGSALLTRLNSLQVFMLGAVLVGSSLLLAIPAPLQAYFSAFAGVGLMQAGVFASIGRVARGEAETSAMNGAFTQLGNLGNVVLPFAMSLLIEAGTGAGIEIALTIVVVAAFLLQWRSQPEVVRAL